MQYKLNTITNLVSQAILLSDERFHGANLEVVKTVLSNNGYPLALLNKQIIKRHKYIIKNKLSDRLVTSND